MLENLTTVNVGYGEIADKRIHGNYNDSNHTITLYEKHDLNTVLHETQHASENDDTTLFWRMNEGYAGALCDAQGFKLTYQDENEYLLLISEANELDKEIKETLAELAIKADENNKENFIILNALYSKYKLNSSLLENEYNYSLYGLNFVYPITDKNKYDYVDVFELVSQRTKIHNK